MKFNSIRFKVGIFYTAVLGVTLVFYTGILYFGQRYALYRDLDGELAVKAQEVANAINSFLPVLENDQRAFYFAANMVIRQQGTYPGYQDIAEEKKQWLEMRDKLNLRNDYLLLSDPEGKIIASSQNLDSDLLLGE